ncbi:hemerythrin [Leptospira langatensis]|uniref:Hemerythrin n=1 Tax=Leptospira langatensis TaxID=2484983 RepID=A0A5F1ZTC0_9LEPT|nr:hemerythrin family protein [Leptospira langatensis]TGK02925.1 hemerythrin [Leptospira langatensis]TGL41680.1 hemerythrin [Leptospira langatensis]
MFHESTIEKIRGIWKTFDLSLGIPPIDKQHLWLIGILVDLEQKFESEVGVKLKEDFAISLNKTLDYTIEHFSLEEKLLEKAGFPKLGHHRLQHIRFIAALKRRMNENIEENFAKAAFDLMKNLKKWLFVHILNEDKGYLEWLKIEKNYQNYDWIEDDLKHSPYYEEIQNLYEKVVFSKKQNISPEFLDIGEQNLKAISELWYRYRLKTGIAIVDIQHLWLLHLLVRTEKVYKQKLKQEIDSSELSDELKALIQSVIEYVKEHFNTEESIMSRFNYIGEKSHIKQHEQFNILIADLTDRSESGDLEAIARLLQDLKDWLISHIAVEDKKLFYFFRSRLPEVNEYVRQLNKAEKIHIWKEAVMIYKLLVDYEDISDSKNLSKQHY